MVTGLSIAGNLEKRIKKKLTRKKEKPSSFPLQLTLGTKKKKEKKKKKKESEKKKKMKKKKKKQITA